MVVLTFSCLRFSYVVPVGSNKLQRFLYQLRYCGTPSSLSNGQRRYSSTTVGSTVTYFYNTGYRLSGSATRTCQSNGSAAFIICTMKTTLTYHAQHTQGQRITENSTGQFLLVAFVLWLRAQHISF